MSGQVTDVISIGEVEKVNKLVSGLRESKALIIDINQAARGFETKIFNKQDYVGSAKAVAELKTQIDGLQAAYELQTSQLKDLIRDREKLLKLLEKEKAEHAKNVGAYAQMKKAYNDAAKAALDLGAVHGSNSKEFLQASANANKLNKELYELEKAVGRNQRNVGNYASGFNALNNSINQITRELPAFANSIQTGLMGISNNIAPVADEINRINRANAELAAKGQPTVSVWKQLGAAIFSWQTALSVGVGLITAYGDDIIEFLFDSAKGTVEAADGTKIFTDESKNLNRIIKESTTSYARVAAEIDILKSRFKSATATLKDKEEVVKTLNEKYENTIGKINGINEAEKFFVDRSDAFIKSLMLRAQIEGAYNAIAENTNALLKQQASDVDDATTGWQKFSAFNKTFFSGAGLKAVGQNLANAFTGKPITKMFETLYDNELDWQKVLNSANVENAVNRSNDVIKAFIDKTQKELTKLNEQFGLGEGQKDKPGKEQDQTNAGLSAQEALIKNRAAAAKKVFAIDADNQRLIIDNEKASLKERLDANTMYTHDRVVMSRIDAAAEAETVQLKLDKIAAIEKKAADKRTNQEKNLLLEKEALTEELGAIEAKAAERESDINRESVQKKIALQQWWAKEMEDLRADNYTRLLNNIDLQYAEEYSRLTEGFTKGLMLAEEYQAKLNALKLKYAKQSVDLQILLIEDLLKTEKMSASERAMWEQKLSELKMTLSEQEANHEIENRKKVIAAARDLANELMQFSKTITEKKLNKLDEELEKIERNKEAEITAINATMMKETDKQKAIMEAENNAQANRDAIERKKMELRRKQAAFEKIANISAIITRTALAVVTTLADSSITPGWLRIGLAAAAGVTGATQLANAIAAPLPTYAEGTDYHPGGAAIVGDGGRPEIVETSKGYYITPSVPTLLPDLEKGATVYPSINDFIDKQGFLPDEYKQSGNTVAGFQYLGAKMDNMVHAYNNRPVNNTNLTDAGLSYVYERGNSKTTFIAQNF